MAWYMIDTSAFVKYDHPEPGSPRIIVIADDPANILFISRIGLVEIHRALAGKGRTGALEALAFQQSLRRFYADRRARKFRLIRPASMYERQAIRLLVRKGPSFPLRTLDALQLAAARWLKDQQPLDHWRCADARRCEDAQQEGLSVIHPEVP